MHISVESDSDNSLNNLNDLFKSLIPEPLNSVIKLPTYTSNNDITLFKLAIAI